MHSIPLADKYLVFNMKIKNKKKSLKELVFSKKRVIKVIFPFRLWLLNFKGWLIVVWFFFKPVLNSDSQGFGGKMQHYGDRAGVASPQPKIRLLNLNLVYNF